MLSSGVFPPYSGAAVGPLCKFFVLRAGRYEKPTKIFAGLPCVAATAVREHQGGLTRCTRVAAFVAQCMRYNMASSISRQEKTTTAGDHKTNRS